MTINVAPTMEAPKRPHKARMLLPAGQIGERIRQHRNRLGITQAELEDRIGFARNHISKLETGIRTPNLRTLAKIALVFRVTLDELCMR